MFQLWQTVKKLEVTLTTSNIYESLKGSIEVEMTQLLFIVFNYLSVAHYGINRINLWASMLLNQPLQPVLLLYIVGVVWQRECWRTIVRGKPGIIFSQII